LGLVFWASQEHRGSQSAHLLARTQCVRKSLALYANGCHAQSLLRDSRRTIFILNFNFPEYPESSISGPRSLTSFSIEMYVALFMQCYISAVQILSSLIATIFCAFFNELLTESYRASSCSSFI
jgi:hypothetical protein